jgi:hypothetical protein
MTIDGGSAQYGDDIYGSGSGGPEGLPRYESGNVGPLKEGVTITGAGGRVVVNGSTKKMHVSVINSVSSSDSSSGEESDSETEDED